MKTDAVIQQAGVLRRKIEENEPWADDVLLFFYRLRDNFGITHSTGRSLQGKSFHGLNSLIYELESRPEETAANREQRALIEAILDDVSSGKIRIKPNSE